MEPQDILLNLEISIIFTQVILSHEELELHSFIRSANIYWGPIMYQNCPG